MDGPRADRGRGHHGHRRALFRPRHAVRRTRRGHRHCHCGGVVLHVTASRVHCDQTRRCGDALKVDAPRCCRCDRCLGRTRFWRRRRPHIDTDRIERRRRIRHRAVARVGDDHGRHRMVASSHSTRIQMSSTTRLAIIAAVAAVRSRSSRPPAVGRARQQPFAQLAPRKTRPSRNTISTAPRRTGPTTW